MVLSDLPEELVLYIADFLDTEKGVLAFAQLNRYFQNTLISYLYHCNAKNSDGYALLLAAENDQESITQQALANGATVPATNRRGETLLHLATQAGNLSMARFLLNVQEWMSISRTRITKQRLPRRPETATRRWSNCFSTSQGLNLMCRNVFEFVPGLMDRPRYLTRL